jgi:diaminopimelate decarboxylase
MNGIFNDVIERFGTPCFVYNFDQVRSRVAAVREAFGGRFKTSYAVKANPNPKILDRMRSVVDLLDVSSAGELNRAIGCGWDARALSFTGPAKRDAELELAQARQIGAVILESVGEARRLNDLAQRVGGRQAVLIRIAPAKIPSGFGVSMAGRPCQFGIDQEDAAAAIAQIKALPNLDLAGFHIFAGTQCLNADTIARAFDSYIELFREFSCDHGLAPRMLVFGSGMGIPYHEQDRPLDLASLGERAGTSLDRLRREKRFAETEFVLETGRYLIGEAGVYLTRIVSRKQSRGAEIRICDGGMNHHLGAAGHLGSLIHRNYRMFKLGPEGAAPTQDYDLFGPLCTSIDMLGHNVKLPPLDVNDVIGIECSGAYGLTASPMHFISHPLPREILVETFDGALQLLDVST